MPLYIHLELNAKRRWIHFRDFGEKNVSFCEFVHASMKNPILNLQCLLFAHYIPIIFIFDFDRKLIELKYKYSKCYVNYTVRIKIKVIHIQRPIVLKTIDLKITLSSHVAYKWRATHPLSICTFLASGMSRMNEYIDNEGDNVMTHFFASFRNWDGRLQWMLLLAIQMDEGLVIDIWHTEIAFWKFG